MGLKWGDTVSTLGLGGQEAKKGFMTQHVAKFQKIDLPVVVFVEVSD